VRPHAAQGTPLTARRLDLVGDGLTAFRSGHFHQARTLWEAEGLGVRGDVRAVINGLAHVAAGFLRCDEGAYAVAELSLFRGVHLLRAGPGRIGSVDAGGVRAVAEQLLSALRLGDPADARALAAALAP
jgi:hypothetical protein